MKQEILFYLCGDEGKRSRFEAEVLSFVPINRRRICESLKELSRAIEGAIGRQCICVVLTDNRQDLVDLFSIQDALRESRLILVLPDDSDDCVELGHSFYPRFSDYIGSGFDHVAAVLAKMADLDPAESISVQVQV